MAFYRRTQERYGLPLDNRRLYTKLDWITWTATLTGSRADFEALVSPVFDFLNSTPHRVPMTDWYWTHDATRTGFQARSVVGGVFLRLLYEDDTWKKWAARGHGILSVPSLFVDTERLRGPNTGLGQVCLHLGRELARQNAGTRKGTPGQSRSSCRGGRRGSSAIPSATSRPRGSERLWIPGDV